MRQRTESSQRTCIATSRCVITKSNWSRSRTEGSVPCGVSAVSSSSSLRVGTILRVPKQKRCQPLLSFRRGTGILDPPLPPIPAAECCSRANRKSEKSASTLRAHSTGIVSFASGKVGRRGPSPTVLSFIISQKDVAELPAFFTCALQGFYCLRILFGRRVAGVVIGHVTLGPMLLAGRRRRVGPLFRVAAMACCCVCHCCVLFVPLLNQFRSNLQHG